VSTELKAAVLNVGDDPSDRSVTAHILARAGFAVREAAAESDALRLAAGQPDLILLQGVSGFEICRRLKQDAHTRSIPILQICATSEERATVLDGGADACLAQPVDPGLLVATIKAMLRTRRAGLWQTAFDAIGHGVCLIDASGRILQVNSGMCALAGKDRQELAGESYQAIDPSAVFERARGSRQHESAELEVAGRWLHVTADPILDDNGEFAGAVLTMIDITALRELPAGVIVAEAPSGRIVLSNELVETIFGGPFRIEADTPLARTIASGEVIANEEIQVTRGDGSRAIVQVSSAPVRNREGFITAGIAILHDVTERNRLERRLRQLQKMEAMGRLAGGVAHDFNNLLTIIGGYSQMSLDSLKPKDRLRGDLEAIIEASNRATDLARQLMTFSGRQIVEPKIVDLNREVTKVSRTLRRAIGEGIELVTSLNAHAARVRIDPAQFEQILRNLATNARDAMPEGGRLTIETASVEIGNESFVAGLELEPGPYVTIAMSDTGAGMDAETMSHLFEPFYTTKGKGKGTGLGLAVVYGIVKQGGGDILVESEPGRGTVVRVYLPAAEEPVRHEHGPRHSSKAGTETILIVEDEAQVRRLANEILSRQGYTVIEAASGAEALRLWQERGRSIDLVLTDVLMPQMSGPEMAEKLKALSPGVKVLYMSAYMDDVIARSGSLEAKAAFLQKPFTLDSLSQKVRAVLDNKERR
jgi:PAS domain S-box-containing protein